MTYLALTAWLVIGPLYLRREWRARKRESLPERIRAYTEREER